MDACQLLTESINVFQRQGWCRGQRENAQGEVCAFGAMAFVLTGNAGGSLGPSSDHDGVVREAVKALREVYKDYKGPGSSHTSGSILGINEGIIENTDEAIAWFEEAKKTVC